MGVRLSKSAQDATSIHPGATGSDDAVVSSPQRPRLWKRTVGVAAMMAVLVVGGSAAAKGGANSSVASGSTGGLGASGAAPSSAEREGTQSPANLHGLFSVINIDRSVQSRQWQWGEVVEIDEISLTVRSIDGFSGSYLIGPGVSVTGIGIGDTGLTR